MEIKDNKINSFEGLRFIFSLLIFLNHCNFLENTERGKRIFNSFFHNGSFGVAFFFVLSGFCIYLGYRNVFTKLSPNIYINFVWKRIKKIWPLYMFTMVWVFLYNISFKGKEFFLEFVKLLLAASMGQTLNVKYWGVLNSAGWFVSCIFILYLLTPLIIKGVNKVEHVYVCKIVVIINILLICFFEILVRSLIGDGLMDEQLGRLLIYVCPMYRFFYYVSGMLVAKIYMLQSDCKKHNNKIRASLIEGGGVSSYNVFIFIRSEWKGNNYKYEKLILCSEYNTSYLLYGKRRRGC